MEQIHQQFTNIRLTESRKRLMGEDNHQCTAEQRWWADGWMYTQSRGIDKEMLV